MRPATRMLRECALEGPCLYNRRRSRRSYTAEKAGHVCCPEWQCSEQLEGVRQKDSRAGEAEDGGEVRIVQQRGKGGIYAAVYVIREREILQERSR